MTSAALVARFELFGVSSRAMSKGLGLALVLILSLSLAAFAWREGALNPLISHFMIPQAAPPMIPAKFSEITIPFELVNEHIMIRAQVNGSRPLSILLDTGDKYGIVDFELAKELGLALDGNISVGGEGPGMKTGAFVKEANFTLPEFPGFSQAVTLAVPIRDLAPLLGHDLDGIIGSEFIKNFAVELDYQKRTITLHNRTTFFYSGPGESIPIHLTSSGHPVLAAAITPIGENPIGTISPINADVELDIGASGALELHGQFVREHHLPGPNVATIRQIGAAGTGGATQGRIGRVAAFKIGKYELHAPLTVFSSDTGGNTATAETSGNLGEEILERFKLFFDYGHDRIIFEPTAALGNAFDRAFSGISVEAEGKDYNVFRIREVLEGSAGAEAGLQHGDVIAAVNGKPAGELTYSDLLEMFKRPKTFKLTVERDGKILSVNLTPRKLN
jgi:PDZ domain/Aspartyl protease